MQIVGDYYRLTPINDSSSRFDLELLHEVKGKNPRSEFKIDAYGLPLEKAIKRIINFAVYKKLDVTTLKEFLKEYKIESEKIHRLIGEAC